jgi:sulfur-oxidizing protein SoxB
MALSRREFLQLLAVAAGQGLALAPAQAQSAADNGRYYDLGRARGNVTLLHFSDCHAQLLPGYFREPDTQIGVGSAHLQPPHLTGETLLKHFGIAANSRDAHAFTHLDFVTAAHTYGAVGGFAHLATLVQQLRAQRPGALLLDGGDTWQGSATALWSNAQDMIDATRQLGVDYMTGHWEFTYGAARVNQVITTDFRGRTEFLAQNVRTLDFEDPVFAATSLREVNGARIAIIGQAYPYTPIANPRHFVPDWTFGIQEERLQTLVDAARQQGAAAVILLSHNGMDIDLKLASRVSGIDLILGGHTHDAVPQAITVANRHGHTQVTNAGANGKFLGVAELDIRAGKLHGCHYRLLPVFANLLPADPAMQTLINRHRAPYLERLERVLTHTNGLLYRRDNFGGSADQLILSALLATQDTEIAFSPGFRWGATLLPNTAITVEDVMRLTAITYPAVTRNTFTGAALKDLLEDLCDNLFNPDPYLQQGGDMVRVAGLRYSCAPHQNIGQRISNLYVNDTPLDPNRVYTVASWASVAPEARGTPIWDVLGQYCSAHQTLPVISPQHPALIRR